MTPQPPFAAFFEELWGYGPFPWQEMLAERVTTAGWPSALDLPTATGKTACIDIAVYALAAQADLPLVARAAPRRTWFVVDRRIVVDEAHMRAQKIATCLRDALRSGRESALAAVAERLLQLSGTDRPLRVGRLRGGVLRDDGCVRIPSQPAVITSTVDQFGSRLLFRAYGPSQLTAPIYAGLAANDSLVVLDEAHCSVPFLQTLRAIEQYRGDEWAEQPIITPFGFVILSATPPPDVSDDAVFPGAERASALHHPILDRRLRTSKLAELVDPIKTSARQVQDALVSRAAAAAVDHVKSGRQRVAVMVNRVATAEETAAELRMMPGNRCDVVLITGRMRPYERDLLIDRWVPYLKADSPRELPRPVVVVSTQCLEVGADFSFDALITEAASLDALRQRFGRLARMGADEPAPAAILIRDRDVDPKQPDSVYGFAIAKTWALLQRVADASGDAQRTDSTVDFGVEALDTTLKDIDDLSGCLAPVEDAPILLPAHLDVLAQTAPPAQPAPDISLFLHGNGRRAPEVQVVWRSDLSLKDPDDVWVATASLCRPASGEMLSVPLHRLHTWLGRPKVRDQDSDVEGVADTTSPGLNDTSARQWRCVLWRGRESVIARRTADIRPGDVVVLPAEYKLTGLAQDVAQAQVAVEAVGTGHLDLWEAAHAAVGRPVAVRLSRAVLKPWIACPPLAELMALVEDEPDRNALVDAIDAVLAYKPEREEALSVPPQWWLKILCEARSGRREQHPAGGLVLFAKKKPHREETEPDLFADEDDLTSVGDREITLEEHSRRVCRAVEKIAKLCLPDELGASLCEAALWHDAGKLDERFQVLLHHGDELAALSAEKPLAKSTFIPSTHPQRRTLRESTGLPDSFRHEMLSMHLMQHHISRVNGATDTELTLHLIASHHGHGRPFAPVCVDAEPPDISGNLLDRQIDLAGQARRTAIPPHCVASGVAERFWTLVHRYGWWGLAYLEAMLRLGDWYASALAEETTSKP